MLGRDISEGERRTERDAGPRIGAVHDRAHVVAARIEIPDRLSGGTEHSRVFVGRKPGRGAEVARVWVSPERARWLREERTVVEELADGAVVVELPYAGTAWLVREILRGAGDLVVLEPADARAAIAKEVTD